MSQRNQHDHVNEHAHTSGDGRTIDRIRRYEVGTTVAFLGRRRRTFTRLAALSGARPGDRVLDIGCGAGYYARLLARSVTPGGRVTGVDLSAAAIAFARRRAPRATSFVIGAAQDLPVPDTSFDVVTSTLTIHHLPEEARSAAFREMYRVARPGGTLLIADFRPAERGSVLHPVGSAHRHGDGVPLAELATGAGFRLQDLGATCPCCATSAPSTPRTPPARRPVRPGRAARPIPGAGRRGVDGQPRAEPGARKSGGPPRPGEPRVRSSPHRNRGLP